MQPKSIIAVLKKDHDEVSHLLKQAMATSDKAGAKREAFFTDIREALTVHTTFEEQHIYPLLSEAKKTRSDTLEAYEEHAQIQHMLEDIARTPTSDPRWKAKVTVLAEDVEHHVKEEEQPDGLFAKLRKAADSDALRQLAEEYQSFREVAGVA